LSDTQDTTLALLEAQVTAAKIAQEMGAPGTKIIRSVWPDRFKNKESGHYYEPHHNREANFVYTHEPRYGLLKGGEGCVAAETLLNDNPIADYLHDPQILRSMFGRAVASPSYLKGRTDLYRVRTQFGAEVEVTGEHRFLSSRGWCRLADLAVGDLIAGHDDAHGWKKYETDTNLSSGYWNDSHQRGELSSPWATTALDKLLQLQNTLLFFCPRLVPFFHAYTKRFSSLLGQRPSEYEKLHQLSPYVFQDILTKLQTLLPFPLLRYPTSNGVERPLCRSEFLVDVLLEGEYQTFLKWALSSGEEYLTYLLSQLYPVQTPREPKPFYEELDHERLSEFDEYLFQYKHRFHSEDEKHLFDLSQTFDQQFSDFLFLRRLLKVFENQFLSVLPSSQEYNNTSWTKIKDITYSKFGDFYDISVPGPAHYSANGLWHHNSGKSTAGVIKDLTRLRLGCNGIMVSSDFPHLKKSLWPEFRNWCPPEAVVSNQRYCLNPTWNPGGFFTIHFYNDVGGYSTLFVGGIEDPSGWEGPNVNFAHFDEARRHPRADALKVLDGRVRITGPNGEPCQLWLTTTPRKHWLYEYFGGVEEDEEPPMQEDDPLKAFKQDAVVVTLKTEDNAKHLQEGFVEKRKQSLSESEARVLMDARWEDAEDMTPFIPISWWDAVLDLEIPIATQADGLVVALDAAVSRDCFGLIAVSSHPLKTGCLAVQAVRVWTPSKDKPLNFMEIEDDIRKFITDYSILKVVYDPFQLHHMAGRLGEIALLEPFQQVTQRQLADRMLRDFIRDKKVWHRGDTTLRQHLANADQKNLEDRKIRIVKREQRLKIDLAVCLSMACFAAQEFVSSNTGYVSMGDTSGSSAIDQLLRA
jgi:hypothetical protein